MQGLPRRVGCAVRYISMPTAPLVGCLDFVCWAARRARALLCCVFWALDLCFTGCEFKMLCSGGHEFAAQEKQASDGGQLIRYLELIRSGFFKIFISTLILSLPFSKGSKRAFKFALRAMFPSCEYPAVFTADPASVPKGEMLDDPAKSGALLFYLGACL